MAKLNLLDYGLFVYYLGEQGLAQSSIKTYGKCVTQFLKYGPDINDCNSYNKFLIQVSERSDKRGYCYFYALKHFIQFKFETKAKEILKNIIKPKMKDPKTVRHHLTKEKRIEVINKLESEKHQVVALIQYLTGLRVGDVLKLKQGDISWEDYKDKKVLRINSLCKGQKRTSVYVTNPTAIDIVSKFIKLDVEEKENKLFGKVDRYYFVTNSKKNIYNRILSAYIEYYKDLKTALGQCNVDITKFASHDFRRGFSRDVWDENNDIFTLKTALNHQNINTTARYLRFSGLTNLEILDNLQN